MHCLISNKSININNKFTIHPCQVTMPKKMQANVQFSKDACHNYHLILLWIGTYYPRLSTHRYIKRTDKSVYQLDCG